MSVTSVCPGADSGPDSTLQAQGAAPNFLGAHFLRVSFRRILTTARVRGEDSVREYISDLSINGTPCHVMDGKGTAAMTFWVVVLTERNAGCIQ